MSLLQKTFTLTTASLVLIGLAGCAGTAAAPGSATSSASLSELSALPVEVKRVDPLAGSVPQQLKDAGLTVATSPNSPPMTYVAEDGKTVEPIGRLHLFAQAGKRWAHYQ